MLRGILGDVGARGLDEVEGVPVHKRSSRDCNYSFGVCQRKYDDTGLKIERINIK